MNTVKIFTGLSAEEIESKIAAWVAQNPCRPLSAQTFQATIGSNDSRMQWVTTIVFTDVQPA